MHNRGSPRGQKKNAQPNAAPPYSHQRKFGEKYLSRRKHHCFTPPPCRNIAVQCRNTPSDRLTAASHPGPPSTARFLARSGRPYHPTIRTRRRVTIMTPGRPAARTPRHRRIAQPNARRRVAPDLRPRFTRPRPLLAPSKRTVCRIRQTVPTSTPAAAAERPGIPHIGGGDVER